MAQGDGRVRLWRCGIPPELISMGLRGDWQESRTGPDISNQIKGELSQRNSWSKSHRKCLNIFILRVTATEFFWLSHFTGLFQWTLFPVFSLNMVWRFHSRLNILHLGSKGFWTTSSSSPSRFRSHGSDHLRHQARNQHKVSPALRFSDSLKVNQSSYY